MSQSLRQKGDTEAARTEAEEAARLTKKRRDLEAAATAVETGKQRLRSGKVDEARERFEAAIQLDPTYPEAYRQLSLLWQKKGNAAKAKEMQAKALELQKQEQRAPRP